MIHGLNGNRSGDKTGVISPNYPFAAYEALAQIQNVLSSLFAYASAFQVNAVVHEQAESIDGLLVSGGFYNGLGVPPVAGRLIQDDDDRPGAPPVTVISYKYWQRRFSSNPNAIGQSILINKVPFTIAGVSAPGFFGVDAALSPDVFMPLHAGPLLAQTPSRGRAAAILQQELLLVGNDGPAAASVSAFRKPQSALAARSSIRMWKAPPLQPKEKNRYAGVVAHGKALPDSTRYATDIRNRSTF